MRTQKSICKKVSVKYYEESKAVWDHWGSDMIATSKLPNEDADTREIGIAMSWSPKREKLDPKQSSAIDFAVVQDGNWFAQFRASLEGQTPLVE